MFRLFHHVDIILEASNNYGGLSWNFYDDNCHQNLSFHHLSGVSRILASCGISSSHINQQWYNSYEIFYCKGTCFSFIESHVDGPVLLKTNKKLVPLVEGGTPWEDDLKNIYKWVENLKLVMQQPELVTTGKIN